MLFLTAVFGGFQNLDLLWKIGLAAGFSSLAIGVGYLKSLEGYQYTFWIIAAVFSGLLFPETFLNIGGLDLRNKWLILIIIQLVMCWYCVNWFL